MKRPFKFWYRWHRCEVYYRIGQIPGGWIGWARRYPDRTTDYYAIREQAIAATRTLVDATLAERSLK